MIFKGIRIELYRVFTSKIFYFTLLASSLIGVIQFILVVFPKAPFIFDGINISYPYSVFNTSMIYDVTSVYFTIFYYSLPLLCAIPYATSYYTDLKNGYIKNICTRYDRKGYYIGKYISVFVSAGLICTIPIIVNLLLTMAFIPSLTPERGTFMFGVSIFGLFNDYFYESPFIYTLIYLVIDFLVCGLLVCMALPFAKIVHNRFIVLFIPFAVFFLEHAISQYTVLYEYDLYNILSPLQSTPSSLKAVITVIIILFVMSFGLFYIGGRKSDII